MPQARKKKVGRPLKPLELSAEESETLERYARRGTTAQRLAMRAKIDGIGTLTLGVPLALLGAAGVAGAQDPQGVLPASVAPGGELLSAGPGHLGAPEKGPQKRGRGSVQFQGLKVIRSRSNDITHQHQMIA